MRLIVLFTLFSFLISCGTNRNAADSRDHVPPAAEWQTLETIGAPTARHENAFVEADGKFYLIGGRGERPVDVYDPETNRWSEASGPSMEIHHFQAVTVNGKIYVVGAWTGGYPDERGIDHVLIYDPETDAWSRGPEIPEDRRRGAAAVVEYKGSIYVVSGNRGGHGPHAVAVDWVDRLDPVTGEWTRLAPIPHPRDHFHAAVVSDKLYAVGGRDSGVEGFIDSTTSTVDVYDFETGTWSTLADAPLPTERAGSATVSFGDYVIITGGEGFGRTWGQTEALDTNTGTWTLIGVLNQPRHGTQAIVHHGTMYVAAGSGGQGGGPELTSMEILHLSE